MLPVNTLEDLSLFTWDPWGFYEENLDRYHLPVELSENSGWYIVRAEVPGVRQKDINVTLDGSFIVIQGNKTDKEAGQQVSFSRTIELPRHVIRDGAIKATLKKGVLEVRLPIERRERPREIAVQAE